MSKSKSLNIDFSKGKEEGYRRVYGQSPLLTNPGDCWDGVYLAYDYQPANETPEVFAPQIGLTIFTEVSENICYEQTINGRFYKKQIVPGDIVITPANIGTRACWNQSLKVIFIGFEPIVFKRTIYEYADTDKTEIIPQFAIDDPLIYQIALTLKSTLENNGTRSRLYEETMVNAACVHLLEHYSTQKPKEQNYQGGLPRHKLQLVIDYIYAHFNENISLTELAALVKMSPRYFLQLFKQSTGITPHKFLISTRIERAKELLISKEMNIAQIAQQVGFSNQSHLNLHFKRLIGITPKQFKKK